MKDLIDAAVQSASRHGIQAAVVLMGPANGNGAHAPAPAPEVAVTPQAANPVVVQERDALRARVQQLEAALQQAHAAAQAQVAGAADPAQAAALQAAQQQVIALQGQVASMEQQLQAAQQAAVPHASGDLPAENQDTVEAFDARGVEHLGLEDKEEKAVRKGGYETIGAVRAAFLSGELKEKTRITKDGLIAVGIHLLGKAPSMSHAGATAAPATGAAPAAATNAAADVPEGHQDRPWMDRLGAARAKEARMQASVNALSELRQEALTKHPDAKLGNGDVDLSKVDPALADKIRGEESTHSVIRGQMIATLWSCNLPADAGGVDKALEAAKLTALVQS